VKRITVHDRTNNRLFASVVLAGAVGVMSAQAPQTPPVGPGPGPVGPGGGGRGGGIGAGARALYVEKCAGCHGIDLSGGRAATLFDPKALARLDDDRLGRIIRAGLPNAGMPAFDDLTEEQVGQLIHHIRAETGNLAPKPAFIANPAGQILKTEKQTVKAELVADGLETPWGLAFLPDGRLLVTERSGNLRIIDRGSLSGPVTGTPKAHVQQDGGMLDVDVHPAYAKNGWIYLAYSEVRPGFTPPAPGSAPPAPAAQPGRGRGPQIPSMTVIVRGKLDKNNQWIDEQLIYRAPPELYTTDGSHFGLRFLFDREGHLFYSIGDRGVMQNSQDLSNALGKIHRVNADGSVPNDNPFLTTPGALPTIWSYGHRNPQGLAWDPLTGRLWESEHGPSGGDEINIVERGRNYGWGVVSKGLANGITKRSQAGLEEPLTYYTPSLGPSAVAFYTGDRFPGWKNTSLFVAGMAGHRLLRLQVANNTIAAEEVIFGQFGRVRDIAQGPDGYLYVALQNPTGAGTGLLLSASTPGRIIRLVPSSN
jgi:glucose/arabinose dehydrogenase